MRHVGFVSICWRKCLRSWITSRCWCSVHVSIGPCKGSSLEIEGSSCARDYSSSKFEPFYGSIFLLSPLFPSK
jgi:hypothetical protein